MRIEKIASPVDGLLLETAISEPKGAAEGIIQFSHGMAEHKERYFDFMNYLSSNGYVCVINDHRGHGGSVKSPEDLGYFYTEDFRSTAEDLRAVGLWAEREYPGLPRCLFSHSMGTLVARCYLKENDEDLAGLVLCGPPTRNGAVDAGLAMAKLCNPFWGKKKPNKLLNSMAFAGYNGKNAVPNSWLSVNEENVTAYNADPLCGYTFTTNGFINLMGMQKDSFTETGWEVEHPGLPILVIAGREDPVIGSAEKFDDLLSFLKERGYINVTGKLYNGKRHELLNENGREEVYEDVLQFFEKC